jgi:hypothetical protein
MEIVTSIAAYIAFFYAIGCILFVSYAALELSSLHKQHEASRDKNLKNALTIIAKEQIFEVKTFWKWPLYVALAIKSAINWAKSL